MTRFSGHLIWREMIASGRSPEDACCQAAGVPASLARAGRVRRARDAGSAESGDQRVLPAPLDGPDAVDTGVADGITSAEKRELVELRRKNRVLEMEVEILKRASASFARENVLPK